MKRIGNTDKHWSTQKAIAEQVEREAWLEWAGKPVQRDETEEARVYVNTQSEFKLTEAAKHAFSRGISLFKL